MEEQTSGASKGKVLIVDDDKFLLDMYSLKFKMNGFEVMAGMGGKDALSKLENGFDPDILLFDIAMPGMDGPEFFNEVRNKGYASHATAVALSNQQEPADIEKVKSLGAAEYLIKASMTPQELIDRVMQIVQEHKK
jgi:CheY-like chemotaxis protein